MTIFLGVVFSVNGDAVRLFRYTHVFKYRNAVNTKRCFYSSTEFIFIGSKLLQNCIFLEILTWIVYNPSKA